MWYPLLLLPPPPPPPASRLPPSNCHQLIVTSRLSSTDCRQLIVTPTTCHPPIVTNHQLSSTNCHQPVAGVVVWCSPRGRMYALALGSPQQCRCDLRGRRRALVWRWPGLAVICVAGAVLWCSSGGRMYAPALAGAAGSPPLCRCDLCAGSPPLCCCDLCSVWVCAAVICFWLCTCCSIRPASPPPSASHSCYNSAYATHLTQLSLLRNSSHPTHHIQLAARASRVAGAVHRAVRRSCRTRGRRWAARASGAGEP